jgi:hypothetical protein
VGGKRINGIVVEVAGNKFKQEERKDGTWYGFIFL